jgi:hypothetical protein
MGMGLENGIRDISDNYLGYEWELVIIITWEYARNVQRMVNGTNA